MTITDVHMNTLDSATALIFDPYGMPAGLRRMYIGQSLMLLCGGPSAKPFLQKIREERPLLMTVNNMWTCVDPDLWVCVDKPDRFHEAGWRNPRIAKFSPITAGSCRLARHVVDGSSKTLSLSPKTAPNSWFYRADIGFQPNTFFTRGRVCIGNSDTAGGADGQCGGRSVMLAAIRIAHHLGVGKLYIVGMDMEMSADRSYAFDAWHQKPSHAYVERFNHNAKRTSKRISMLAPYSARDGMQLFQTGKGPLKECAIDEAILACKPVSQIGCDVRDMYTKEKTNGPAR